MNVLMAIPRIVVPDLSSISATKLSPDMHVFPDAFVAHTVEQIGSGPDTVVVAPAHQPAPVASVHERILTWGTTVAVGFPDAEADVVDVAEAVQVAVDEPVAVTVAETVRVGASEAVALGDAEDERVGAGEPVASAVCETVPVGRDEPLAPPVAETVPVAAAEREALGDARADADADRVAAEVNVAVRETRSAPAEGDAETRAGGLTRDTMKAAAALTPLGSREGTRATTAAAAAKTGATSFALSVAGLMAAVTAKKTFLIRERAPRACRRRRRVAPAASSSSGAQEAVALSVRMEGAGEIALSWRGGGKARARAAAESLLMMGS